MRKNTLLLLAILLLMFGCNEPKNDHSDGWPESYPQGTYGYDLNFLQEQNIDLHELTDSITGTRVMVIPQWQGRVMTSTASGLSGLSYGWINYELIKSGETNPQFNPYGGEERFWLGPEGGPYSIFFAQGKEQVFRNWKVPGGLDTQAYEVSSKNDRQITFEQLLELENAGGNLLKIGVNRQVQLLDESSILQQLGLSGLKNLKAVAYQSVNTITNRGTNDWTEEDGFVSIWLLSMFNPSEEGIVFIPFQTGTEEELGKIVTDDYFGKVPADRLKIKDGVIYFKVDGKKRSKIGISPRRALPYSGGYDPIKKTLTIVWYDQPEMLQPYVNSKWGDQEDPLVGDAVNSYNDGPVEDGSIMGPFYEIETSSPAALLKAKEQLTHTQKVFHFQGDTTELAGILQTVFDISLSDLNTIF